MELVLKEKNTLTLTFLGVGLLATSAQIAIPFGPVPFTMQTFAILLIAFTQEPKQAFLSTLAYLFAATIGLPVLAGGSYPLWMLSKSAGYLFAFPFSAALTSYLTRSHSFLFASVLGQLLIYLVGYLWLIPFLGTWPAFYYGVAVFIPSNMVKIALAISLRK